MPRGKKLGRCDKEKIAFVPLWKTLNIYPRSEKIITLKPCRDFVCKFMGTQEMSHSRRDRKKIFSSRGEETLLCIDDEGWYHTHGNKKFYFETSHWDTDKEGRRCLTW